MVIIIIIFFLYKCLLDIKAILIIYDEPVDQ